MSEQRQEVYFRLIQSLLNCHSNNEVQEILARNQDLLDADFVVDVEAFAEWYTQQGKENTAHWLRGLASQLREAFNLNTTLNLPSSLGDGLQAKYFQFLMEVLQTTSDNSENPELVYTLLAKNIDKLDDTFAEILRSVVTQTLAEVEADVAASIALVIVDFSDLIGQFPLGSKASNMEIAIAGYEVAGTVVTPTAFPQNWAMTQNNLGLTYRKRIKGDKAENLENAIAVYQQALTVFTPTTSAELWARTQHNLGLAFTDRIKGDKAENLENAIAAYQQALTIFTPTTSAEFWARTQHNLGLAFTDRIKGDKAENLENEIAAYQQALTILTLTDFPQDWARTQNNLGVAYKNRIKGDKAENLENAIAAYQQAFTVRTATSFPQDWAGTQNNLGLAYIDRIKGDKAENLENAIAAYQQALTVFTPATSPKYWAVTQHNLGLAYINRIKGDKAENLENAIVAYQQALTVLTLTSFPKDWAMTQNSLGTAYTNRIKGDQSENVENAIAAYQQALTVRTATSFPQDWAGTQNNLGLAYRNRIKGDKAENLENTITALQKVLTVFTLSAFPQNWAMTQNNLGLAYTDRIKGDKAENLENAIAAYQQALTVYTVSSFPQDWAMTQSNLGFAYTDRIKGDKAENLENAIAAYQQALTILTPTAFPQNYAQTAFGLGLAYQNKLDFAAAYQSFADAITTVETIRKEIISGKETKQKQSEEWNTIYRCIVLVSLALGKETEAIEYAERSKTRNLVEQILERDFRTIFPPNVITKLEQLRDKIAIYQSLLQNNQAENPKALEKHLQQLHQESQEIQDLYLPIGYSFRFDQFQRSLDESTAILEWYITKEMIVTFIIKPQGQTLTCWQYQPEDLQALTDWAVQYLQNYNKQKDQWQNSLGEELKKLASILHIDEILAQIPKHCDKLILIPHRFLHLLPLHALPVSQNSDNSPYLMDIFAGGVSYAPSCQILQQVQKRQRPNFQSLFAIQNPTGDLNYTDLEVQVIQTYFNTSTSNVLKKTAATLTAINNTDLNTYHCAHFSCHGYFNFINPSQSALILANVSVADTVTQPNTERYLNLRSGETHDLDKCLTLDKIFSLKLEKCRLVTLSACETGLIDFQNTSDEYIGLPSGFLLAGSQAVVSSLWTVSDLSTAFLMMKFYENLQTINNVSLALNQAQQWLRNLTTEEFEELLVKYHPQIEEIFAQLPEEKRPVARAILKRTCKRKPYPFAAPFYWAGFTATGL